MYRPCHLAAAVELDHTDMHALKMCHKKQLQSNVVSTAGIKQLLYKHYLSVGTAMQKVHRV